MAVEWAKDILRAQTKVEKQRTLEKAIVAWKLGSIQAQAFLYNVWLAYNTFYVFNLKKIPMPDTTRSHADNPWQDFWAFIESIRTNSRSQHSIKFLLAQYSMRFDQQTWEYLCVPVLKKNFHIPRTTVYDAFVGTDWRLPKFEPFKITVNKNSIQHMSLERVRIEPVYSSRRVLFFCSKSTVQMLSQRGEGYSIHKKIIKDMQLVKSLWHEVPGVQSRFILDGILYHNGNDTQFLANDLINFDEFANEIESTPLEERLHRLYFPKNDLIDFTKLVAIMPGIQYNSGSINLTQTEFFKKIKNNNNIKKIIVRKLDNPYHSTVNAQVYNIWDAEFEVNI